MVVHVPVVRAGRAEPKISHEDGTVRGSARGRQQHAVGRIRLEKVAAQPVAPAVPFVTVQLIPAGVLVTVPLPLP